MTPAGSSPAGTRSTAPTPSTAGATTRRAARRPRARRCSSPTSPAIRPTAPTACTSTGGEPPEIDNTMQHERSVFQVLRRHFERYTPQTVWPSICGCAPADVDAWREALCENSGRERTSALVYSVGWTQHTVGVQNIRAAAIVQLLLGNIGRPGGGILALRGHANIQGSTDIPTLYDILPGLHPDAPSAGAPDARQVRRAERSRHRGVGQPAAVHRVAAEGVVGRGRDRGERVLLRLPAARSTAITRTTR